MARQRGIIKINGAIGGITHVDSAAYGAHSRAARGTHKEAKVNDVLQGNANNSGKVGPLGSPILRQLKAIDKGFAAGNLWPRMTGRMFKAKSMKMPDLLQSLKSIELNERYTYSKLFGAAPKISFSIK